MKATSDFDGMHLVVGAKQFAELIDAFPICALRQADEDRAIDTQDISSVQSSWFGEESKRPVTREYVCQATCFRSPARRSHIQNDGDLVHDYRRILDEDGIRKFWFGGKGDDSNPQACETILICFVLHDGPGEVDRLPGVKRQLAIVDTRADLSNNGRQGHDRT